jgi:hypothetical protein
MHTRSHAKTDTDAQYRSGVQTKEKRMPEGPQNGTGSQKRKSTSSQELGAQNRKRVRPATSNSDEGTKATEGRGTDDTNELQKPRLRTPDLEFDFDRSQLRDPRATPGRKVPPRYGNFDIPKDVKEHLEATRYIPEPEQPKGRLNRAKKNQLFRDRSRLNPMAFSHDLHLCHDKGPEGSQTYDEAGFQLDYDKVAQWMKPRAYNKKQILRNRDGELLRLEREKDQIFKLFFVEVPKKLGLHQEDLVKDHVSKDLGLAWHQIKPKHVKT